MPNRRQAVTCAKDDPDVWPRTPYVSHYGDVIMGTMVSQITSLTIVYSTVYSDADQRKHQSSASLALMRGLHRRPVYSPHKWPVTRKMFPFDDVIMIWVNYARSPTDVWDFVGHPFCITLAEQQMVTQNHAKPKKHWTVEGNMYNFVVSISVVVKMGRLRGVYRQSDDQVRDPYVDRIGTWRIKGCKLPR